MLVEHREVQLIRPPVLVRPGRSPLGSRGGDCRVLALADARRRVLRIKHVLIRHVVVLLLGGASASEGPILPRPDATTVHYEAEVCLVMGKRAKGITEAQIKDH